MTFETKSQQPALTRALLGFLLVCLPATLSAQSISNSQTTTAEVEKMVKQNSLVVTSLDFNSGNYPFDGVSPQVEFYHDPDSGFLRKVKSYRAFSMIGETLEVFYSSSGIRLYVSFDRRRSNVETLSNGKTQVSEELLTNYRIYTFGDTILKIFQRSTDVEGNPVETEHATTATAEAQSILDTAQRLAEFYQTMKATFQK